MCRQCGADAEAVGCLSYAGCPACKPEVKDGQKWRLSSGDGAAPSTPGIPPSSGRAGYGAKRYPKGTVAASRLCSLVCAVQIIAGTSIKLGQPVEIAKNPIYHIPEEPGGIDRMASIEVPPEAYYKALRRDLAERHPQACPCSAPRRCRQRSVRRLSPPRAHGRPDPGTLGANVDATQRGLE